jgi:hypothetical protein
MQLVRCVLAIVLVAFYGLMSGVASGAEDDTAWFRQAKIDWQQFKGTILTIAMNKHPWAFPVSPP